MHRSLVWVVTFFVALVVNPNLGCGSGKESQDYTYGESDMERAVVGTYAGEVSVDGAAETITLTVVRSSNSSGALGGLRPQCGSRTFFVKPAGACASLSTMALTAELVSTGTIVKTAQLTGQFIAYYTLTGELDLSDGSVRLSATYQDGQFSGWMYQRGDGGAVTTLDLRRQ